MISVIISLNTLVMHDTKIMFFFLRQTRHADYYHRYYNHRDRHVGYHIWDRNCYDLKRLQFSLKRRGITNTYINSSFLNVNHA